jgi:hypothetical protein
VPRGDDVKAALANLGAMRYAPNDRSSNRDKLVGQPAADGNLSRIFG